jgi:hypothetical protein
MAERLKSYKMLYFVFINHSFSEWLCSEGYGAARARSEVMLSPSSEALARLQDDFNVGGMWCVAEIAVRPGRNLRAGGLMIRRFWRAKHARDSQIYFQRCFGPFPFSGNSVG